MNIWQKLRKPILILAPMEDVTDTVFRQIVALCSPPDLYMTEFTNVDGLVSEGRNAVIHRLKFTERERPVVAQIWGMNPKNYHTVAGQLVDLGFDGIDINMGCPEKSVVEHGACAALIENRILAAEIIASTKEGAAGRIPVSVKTRIGYKNISQDWIPFLLEQNLDAITIHGRTVAEMSAVPAHWDEIGKAVKLRNAMKSKTVIIGNGDVKDAREAIEKAKQYGVDGVMIGRGIFDNLWAFDTSEKPHVTSPVMLLTIMRRHVELFEREWGNAKNYATLRKFFKIYVRGFEGASEWRVIVMATRSPGEVYPIIDEMMRMVQ